MLAGSVAQIQDKLGRLQAAGVEQLCIPTFLPPWNLEQLDRFMTEVAPAFGEGERSGAAERMGGFGQ